MTASSTSLAGISPAIIERSLTVVMIGLAFAFPGFHPAWFIKIERRFGRLARKKGWAVTFVGITAFLLRLAILPVCPVPLPFVPDDFSFLLQTDTFLHGRLTNPTPAMWIHFENIHITMLPTYQSMYFPMPSLVLAAGKFLTGNPWFGLLVVTSMMCAAICWMLQAWLPPGWALLGGIVAILRLGLFSYWINSFNGGGSIAALGGALVLGAFPRLMRTMHRRDGILLALGICILMLSRPYEGVLLCLPVAFVLVRWLIHGNNPFGRLRPNRAIVLRRAALPLVLVLAAGSWLAYYDYRNFGSPTTLPYTIDRATYAVMPYFVWQPMRPTPAYRNDVLRKFYAVDEARGFAVIRSPGGFIQTAVAKLLIVITFFAGACWMPSLIMMKRALSDRRMRFLAISLALLLVGMIIQIFLIPHYLAPFTATFYALGLQATRHLRLWRIEGRKIGLTIVNLTVPLCLALACMHLFAKPLNIRYPEWPPSGWLADWYGPEQFGTERAQLKAQLESLPGKQLAIVRYGPDHQVLDDWVYNDADIDNSRVIWARELNDTNNKALLEFYRDRKAWLVQPDINPNIWVPYPEPARK